MVAASLASPRCLAAACAGRGTRQGRRGGRLAFCMSLPHSASHVTSTSAATPASWWDSRPSQACCDSQRAVTAQLSRPVRCTPCGSRPHGSSAASATETLTVSSGWKGHSIGAASVLWAACRRRARGAAACTDTHHACRGAGLAGPQCNACARLPCHPCCRLACRAGCGCAACTSCSPLGLPPPPVLASRGSAAGATPAGAAACFARRTAMIPSPRRWSSIRSPTVAPLSLTHTLSSAPCRGARGRACKRVSTTAGGGAPWCTV